MNLPERRGAKPEPESWSACSSSEQTSRGSSPGSPVYTLGMRSVADDLREELRDEVNQLSVQQRMELALRLGKRGLEAFQKANGLDRKTALRELQRRRQAGRTPSKCMSEIIG